MKTTIYSVQPHFQTSRNPEVDWKQEEIDKLKEKNSELENKLYMAELLKNTALENVRELRKKNEQLRDENHFLQQYILRLSPGIEL